LCRRFGDLWVFGQHDGDRLTGVSHFSERQDRLIVKCRPEIRVRDDPKDVLAGNDRIHAVGR